VASLIGVIVSHIIVLFDFIEESREHGVPLHRAVIDAGLVRLRPVLVTVLATVGGLVPLAIEGGPKWQQLVYVLIGGLLLATLVTKGVVPLLYVVLVEELRWISWEPTRDPDVPRAPPGPKSIAVPSPVARRAATRGHAPSRLNAPANCATRPPWPSSVGQPLSPCPTREAAPGASWRPIAGPA
jgi:predicted RND superfamily exporter protein